MAGTVSGEAGIGRSMEGNSSGYRPHIGGEAITEWRSSEQLENGTPSTSPPYWDSDDDGDLGAKPSELYGKYTWKIEKFSKINKRELRSNAFEVGGYKWYILIYPQGCDVSNHLSLFLCVANHDKLLPGWSHFAQFTIAVVNKDPKKSKYSDTLHRFWKKEHDWGWKKFMELSKVLDGFVEEDTLVIKAQVQVIRERADRPFRCLDCQYRRELVRVYLTNVEQICRRFVEERRGKLAKLIEDKAKWSSFYTFWLGVDQTARQHMSKEKSDIILKGIVKHFFIEKEVTSTLVMDSLYSGLRALEGQTKCKKDKKKVIEEAEEMVAPIIGVEKDMFVLVNDVLRMLERAAFEPLPPKDDKGPQNRTKDWSSGEDFNKDSIECDEKRLTELGRRTVEIFFLDHIFSKIEVAYQEAVALRMQEELIREEEAAWQAEGGDHKSKRGVSEKEKKSKKKQAKQKKNNRNKEKEKRKNENSSVSIEKKKQEEEDNDVIQEFLAEEEDDVEYVDESNVIDSIDETLHANSEHKEIGNVNWEINISEIPPSKESNNIETQSGLVEKKSVTAMDDSSSTCSTDSIPSVVINGPYKGNSYPQHKTQKSPVRGKNQREGSASAIETDTRLSEHARNHLNDDSKVPEPESKVSKDRMNRREQNGGKKEENVVSAPKKFIIKEKLEHENASKEKTVAMQSSHITPARSLPSIVPKNSDSKNTPTPDRVPVRNTPSHIPNQTDKTINLSSSFQNMCVTKPENQKPASPKITKKTILPSMTRPSSAPILPPPRPSVPIISTANTNTSPSLGRSVSSMGWFGPGSNTPQSYRNAMMGNVGPTTSSVSSSTAHIQPPHVSSAPMYVPPRSSEMANVNFLQPGFSYGDSHWSDYPPRNTEFNRIVHRENQFFGDSPTSSTSGLQQQPRQGTFTDEFPHIDIINNLFEDDNGVGNEGQYRNFNYDPRLLNRQFSYPGEMGSYNEDAFQQGYFRQTNPYANSESQWQVANSDSLAYANLMSEYLNPAAGVNGYSVFRPSNGH